MQIGQSYVLKLFIAFYKRLEYPHWFPAFNRATFKDKCVPALFPLKFCWSEKCLIQLHITGRCVENCLKKQPENPQSQVYTKTKQILTFN